MAAQTTSPTAPDPQTPPGEAPAAGDAAAAGSQGPAGSQAAAGSQIPAEPAPPGFRERGRMRRRLRFLRRARELAYRDLGGLVFEMHRLGRSRETLASGEHPRLDQRHDELVAAKLQTLGHIDAELRALQDALDERGAVTVLREAGIAACPRCAAIHGSDDRYCPVCGLSMGRKADRPMAATPPGPATGGSPANVPAPPPASAQAFAAALTSPSIPAPAPVVPIPPSLAPALAPPGPAPAPAPPASALRPPVATPAPPSTAPVSPASPASTPPVATPAPQTPAGPDEDRPTEIIRPSDNVGA
jgi:hypothetical protein